MQLPVFCQKSEVAFFSPWTVTALGAAVKAMLVTIIAATLGAFLQGSGGHSLLLKKKKAEEAEQ